MNIDKEREDFEQSYNDDLAFYLDRYGISYYDERTNAAFNGWLRRAASNEYGRNVPALVRNAIHKLTVGIDLSRDELDSISERPDMDEQKAGPSDEELAQAMYEVAGVYVEGGEFHCRRADMPRIAKNLLSKYAAPVPKGEPRAYEYEIASTVNPDGTYSNWSLRLSHHAPNVPPGSFRNLTSLYAAPVNEQDVKDAQRLDFVITNEAQIQYLDFGAGKYRLGWPDEGEVQDQWYESPREAIDAAIAQQGKQ